MQRPRSSRSGAVASECSTTAVDAPVVSHRGGGPRVVRGSVVARRVVQHRGNGRAVSQRLTCRGSQPPSPRAPAGGHRARDSEVSTGSGPAVKIVSKADQLRAFFVRRGALLSRDSCRRRRWREVYLRRMFKVRYRARVFACVCVCVRVCSCSCLGVCAFVCGESACCACACSGVCTRACVYARVLARACARVCASGVGLVGMRCPAARVEQCVPKSAPLWCVCGCSLWSRSSRRSLVAVDPSASPTRTARSTSRSYGRT